MPIVSTIPLTSLPLYTPPSPNSSSNPTLDHHQHVPFTHHPTYLTLTRMLTRYSHLLLTSSSSDRLTPLQLRTQSELYSPLPYHRIKWTHSVEYARTLLLQLEHKAQGIRVQRVKRDVLRELAGMRGVVRRLRAKVEEVGREVDATGERAWEESRQREGGETLAEVLRKKNMLRDGVLKEGKVVTDVEEEDNKGGMDNAATILDGKPYTTSTATREARGELFRRRGKQPDSSEAKTSGFESLPDTERTLLADSRTQADLTTSLVSMAALLKQSARNFQSSLDQDKTLLDRAVEGLDKNVSGMEAASRSMAFLKRMSEEKGLWGRLQLYAIILGLWVAAVLLVFVGPKFRF